MKTATIEAYPVFGTHNTYSVVLKYYGKQLFAWCGHDVKEMITLAETHAANRGFHKNKIILNSIVVDKFTVI